MRVTSDCHSPRPGDSTLIWLTWTAKEHLYLTLLQVEPFKSQELGQKWRTLQTEEDLSSVPKSDSVTLEMGEPPWARGAPGSQEEVSRAYWAPVQPALSEQGPAVGTHVGEANRVTANP